MQYFLPGSEADSTPGLRFRRPQAQRRAQRQGLHLLGPVGSHVVLPVGVDQQFARHQQRFGRQRRQAAASGPVRRAQALHPGLCQRAPPQPLFEDLFYRLLETARSQAQQSGIRHKFRFKNQLLSIDATTIELCDSVFDWAQFHRTTGTVKLHLMLDLDGLLPCYGVITDGKQHEVTVTRQWEFAPGTILAFDRGYTDYNWFERLTQQGVYFVTRQKTNADIIEVEDLALPQRQGLVSDQVNDPFQAPETPPTPQLKLAFV